MIAEFIYQPTSGQFEEKSFDLETIWKSPEWCWVKFITDNGNEWVGAFRGAPVKTAIAKEIRQVAILTSDCLYILDNEKKTVLFQETQTQYKDLIEIPTQDKFLVADYYHIGLLDKNFEFQYVDTEYSMDFIKFKNYNGAILNIEFELVPEYNRVNGFIDTNEWKITYD